MVLEALINPNSIQKSAKLMVLLGFLYTIVAGAIALWIFYSHASLVVVFLTTMAAMPMIYSAIKQEEEKDLEDRTEQGLLIEHWKTLSAFMNLFIGFTLAFALLYVVTPHGWGDQLLQTQLETIQAINGRATDLVGNVTQTNAFIAILSNNMRVLAYCIAFAFIYGSGAIFVLTWNASVIGAAIGHTIRSGIYDLSSTIGLSAGFGSYFHVVSIGLFKYVIHGVPEILAYFTAGLAGGIISIAVIRHNFTSQQFFRIVLDSADLLLISVGLVIVAAILEVWVTPIFF